MPDRRYEVRVTGRLSDQLHQILDLVQSLGLHIVSVQQVVP
jgi:hypothetical protein